MTRFTVILALLVVIGCGPAADPAPKTNPASSGDLTAKQAQPLIHSAAAIPATLLEEVTAAGATVSIWTMSTCPLSILLLSVKVGETEGLRSLWKEGDPRLPPDRLRLPAETGRVTLIPLEGISILEISTEEDHATGTLQFRREGLLEGKGEFDEERADGDWRIVEFRIPAGGAKTTLQEDGSWKPAEY